MENLKKPSSELIIPIQNLQLEKYQPQINSWLAKMTKNTYKFVLTESSCGFMRQCLIDNEISLSIEYGPTVAHIRVYEYPLTYQINKL